MASKTDFNVSPYFDDYSEDKKFHRVMYRPAFAVQARELTTQQSITQNQIEKFGDHMFKHGAMVVPGQVEPDFHYNAVKLTSFNGTLTNYNGNVLTGGTSGVVADVVNVVATDGTDPDTLFVKYRNSGTDNASNVFTDGETLTTGHSSGVTAVCSTTAQGAAVKIEAGTYYINGFFVGVDEQTLILDKYTNTPSYRVGLTISETFVTSTDDSTLLDNATGSSNANATGAHRFKIELTLTKLSLTSTADASFVELLRVQNGSVVNKVMSTDYSVIEDTLARRTFDESGDYVVRNFDLDPREHLISGTNRGIYATDATSADGNTASESKLALGLSQGKAYVKGYEIQKHGTTYVDIDKARDFDTASGIVTRVSQLPFVNVTNVFGTPDVGFVSGETEAYKKVRLVSAVHATRGTVQVNNDGTVFDIGRAKSRGIEYNSGTASGVFMSTGSLTSNTYKHYLFDTVMFAHLNVYGPASGALTDGETLTGGTSGATALILDAAANLKFISSNDKNFIVGETITGESKVDSGGNTVSAQSVIQTLTNEFVSSPDSIWTSFIIETITNKNAPILEDAACDTIFSEESEEIVLESAGPFRNFDVGVNHLSDPKNLCVITPDYMNFKINSTEFYSRQNQEIKRFLNVEKKTLHICINQDNLFLDKEKLDVLALENQKDVIQSIFKLEKKYDLIIITDLFEVSSDIYELLKTTRDKLNNNGKIILVEEKNSLLKKMGQKILKIELSKPINKIPDVLSNFNLKINKEKNILTYIYDTKKSNTGITSLLSEIKNLGMQLKDISTKQSSLESIFLNLVKESKDELVRS